MAPKVLVFSASAAFLWAAPSGGVSSTDECFGWTCYDPEAVLPSGAGTRAAKTGTNSKKARRLDGDFCDLPVLDAEEVSWELLRDPAWRRKPFLLRNSVAMSQEAFGRERLTNDAEKEQLHAQIGHSWSIVQNRGEGPETVLLHEFLRALMHRDWYDGEARLERPYLFHRFGDMLTLPSAKLKLHTVFTAWNSTAFLQKTSTPIALVGAAESGTGFHMHQASVQMTIHGWKRWFFYAPAGNPPGGVHGAWSILDWFKIVYPTLSGKSKPLECIQKPGDSIWIPEFWYHATINLADTVAVSIQRMDGETEVSKLHKRYEDLADKKNGVEYVRRLTELQPGNLASQLGLSKLLAESDPDEALRILRGVLEADKFHVEAQQFFAEFLQDRISRHVEGASQELEGALREWRPYLENNTRSLAANRMLAKYYQLIGDRERHSHYTSRIAYLRELGIKDGKEGEDHVPTFMYIMAAVPLAIIPCLLRARRLRREKSGDRAARKEARKSKGKES